MRQFNGILCAMLLGAILGGCAAQKSVSSQPAMCHAASANSVTK